MSFWRMSLVMTMAVGPAMASPIPRGEWVALQVEVGGGAVPLYAAEGGSRYYVEARKGQDYVLRLINRTAERLAVEVTVDGLNVISGERDTSGHDRMYVLDPWERTVIRGWRTSLDEVRKFTFVDEDRSYAARSDKANGKMGWVELAVYRERTRRPRPWRRSPEDGPRGEGVPSAPPAAAQAPERSVGERDSAVESRRAEGYSGSGRAKSYPGTGWGAAVDDPVTLVDFDAEASPIERLTVRYEYRDALYALGILPERRRRLEQRERGEYGFAQPPRR